LLLAVSYTCLFLLIESPFSYIWIIMVDAKKGYQIKKIAMYVQPNKHHTPLFAPMQTSLMCRRLCPCEHHQVRTAQDGPGCC
jgi:hypothetical protein